MDMVPVSSRNLSAVGYEPSSAILRIQFNNGKLYEYYDVPQYIYDELVAAESKGSYAHKNIYKAFRQSEI